MVNLVILGGGVSGYGSAILAKKQGLDVFLSDAGSLRDDYRKLLQEWKVPFEEGGHTLERILSADEVVKSPGIPDTAPVVQALLAQQTPIVSEIEFAGRYTKARTICVTGSNGKTTTTTLIYQMLRDAGFDVGLGGNIGESFAYQVATKDRAWYVLELSSFQLDGCRDFRADIAVLTNITPDHLDRYDGSFDLYAASKMRVARGADTFIYQSDDPKTAEMVLRDPPAGHVATFTGADNFAAATLAARAAGVPQQGIEATIKAFIPPAHRLQTVAMRNGVEWIDDSKATNVDSVAYAFRRVTKPVIWIAGGTDKGNDYTALYEFMPRVKALVCMGLDNTRLARAFAGRVAEIFDTRSLDDALATAQRLATAGDAVLLSPACASFDLFKNYEDRGNQFAEWVKRS